LFATETYSQVTKINLSVNNATVNEILHEIETKTDFLFVYNQEEINLARRTSVQAKEEKIVDILSKVFSNTDVIYVVEGNNVMLLKRPAPAIQQQNKKQITGTVVDEQGEPVIGANVVEKGTTNGTVTNFSGHYSLDISTNDAILVFSYIGYNQREVKVGTQTALNVTLQEDTHALDEVVVVGYGTQKKVTLTGSISTVKGEDMVKSPATDASQMMTGLLPGLSVIQRSGEPGNEEANTIRIRGINTLGNNDPLIVVDGVPGRSLSRIDENSIESITILKDASAAIYGSRAANGVILITTKRGKDGKPVVTLNLNQGFNRPSRLPKMSNGSEYATLINEIDMYQGRTPRYTDEEIKRFTDGSDPWRYPNTDWLAETFKPWSSQNNINASVSGGRDDIKYHVSAGTKYQDAFYRNSISDYRQADLRSNIDVKLSQYVKVALDVYGRMGDQTLPARAYGMIFRTATIGNPNIHARWPDGSPGPDVLEGTNPLTVSTNAAGYDKRKTYSVNSTAKIDVIIPWVKGLSFNGSANYDKSMQNRTKWETPWEVNTWDGKTLKADGTPQLASATVPFNDPRLTRYLVDNQTLLLNGVLNYEKKFGRHAFNLMAGMESIEDRGNDFEAYRRYFASTALPELFAGGTQDKDNTGKSYQKARMNYFGRLNYNYMEKYMVEFVWRYDGSYIFPKDNRFGFFPGISLGYRISEEGFWKEKLSFFEEMKLRFSYGQTGNDRINEWQYLSSYAYSSNVYNFGITEAGKLSYESRIPNTNITWEKANQMDVGFETYLLNHKLFFEFDYFDYRRSNILWKRNASIPQSTGLTLPRENIGKVTNHGFDFHIRYQDRIQKVGYSISFNGGYARNKITFWDEAPGREPWQVSTGHPIPTDPENADNDLYYQAIGIFRDQAAVDAYPHWENARPGDIIFKDVDDDGKITGLDRVRSDKNNIPRFTGGLKLGVNYRQFDLSALFQGAAGAVRFVSMESGLIGNFTKYFYDHRWTSDNIDASGPRAYNRDAEYWRNNRNTFFLYNSDYIRLKTLELGYSVPKSFASHIGFANIRLYVSGYNLLTFTSAKMKDFDPESNSNDIGGQSQPYPSQQVINGGISLTFK
jgi:TonB-linked SusC/RagA family outer membrane protein